MQVPGMIDEMSDLSVSGVQYYRYEGRTKYQEPYRVTYFLDHQVKRRYRVVIVDGKTQDSSWENMAAELDAGAGVWARAGRAARRPRYAAPSGRPRRRPTPAPCGRCG